MAKTWPLPSPKPIEPLPPVSDEELEMSDREAILFRKRIAYLDGTPSSLAETLRKKYFGLHPDEKAYPDHSSYLEASYAFHKEKLFDCAQQLASKYNLEPDFDSRLSDTWQMYPNKFCISVGFDEDIHHHHVIRFNDLDYNTFKNFYRDLYSLGLHPYMAYALPEFGLIQKDSFSLGYLRQSDLIDLGFESKEAIEKELQKVGLDEKSNADYLSLKSDVPAFDKPSNKYGKENLGR